MEISVIYATQKQQPWINLDVPDECTIREAFELSGLAEQFPELDIESSRVGVFGKLGTLSTPLKAGDRVEIYRPIIRDLDEDDDDDDD